MGREALLLRLADPEKHLDKRRLAILKIQTEILRSMVERLIDKGYCWILPVILSKTTDPLWPDPDFSIEKRVEVDIYGERVVAMQSMIIHKRVLVSLGPEKIFILSPNIRIERRDRASTGRHLYEFTQLEIEAAYAKMEDIFRIFEELIVGAMKRVKDELAPELELLGRDLRIPSTPFKVYRRSELEEKYGRSWPVEVARNVREPVWVRDIPREFYDYEDPKSGEWRNYDLILPEGFGEVISGAEREYEYEKILMKLEKDGIDKSRYRILLDLAKKRLLKPSAGGGLGVERFVAYVAGVSHVAEVQPFPRIPGIVPEL